MPASISNDSSPRLEIHVGWGGVGGGVGVFATELHGYGSDLTGRQYVDAGRCLHAAACSGEPAPVSIVISASA